VSARPSVATAKLTGPVDLKHAMLACQLLAVRYKPNQSLSMLLVDAMQAITLAEV
jgi:hypothetical protein